MTAGQCMTWAWAGNDLLDTDHQLTWHDEPPYAPQMSVKVIPQEERERTHMRHHISQGNPV